MPGGRPSKLTPDVEKKLVDAVRAGNSREAAAKVSGISEATFYNWLSQGREAKRGRFLEFLEAIKKAEGEAEQKAMSRIVEAGQKHWQATAWWLERKYPNRWARRERHEVTGKDGGKLSIELVRTIIKDAERSNNGGSTEQAEPRTG